MEVLNSLSPIKALDALGKSLNPSFFVFSCLFHSVTNSVNFFWPQDWCHRACATSSGLAWRVWRGGFDDVHRTEAFRWRSLPGVARCRRRLPPCLNSRQHVDIQTTSNGLLTPNTQL